MKKTGNLVKLNVEDYNTMLKGSALAGLGNMVGTGKGSTIHLSDNGPVTVDFGLCGFCGQGHYVSHNPNALFGVCDYCGAS